MALDQFNDTTWRVRLSDSSPGLAHLSLLDYRSVVTRETLDAATAAARSIGATRVRTSAMPDASATLLSEAGFVDVDRLVVLRRPIGPIDSSDRKPPTSRPTHHERVRLRRLGRRWLDDAARVDAAAFGPSWSIDQEALGDIPTATPTSWGRRATIARTWFGRDEHGKAGSCLAGFVLCGASGFDGYIQRLAVDPAFQGRGVATALMRGALEWITMRGCTTALTNTRPDNVAALALYTGMGFQRLAEQLIVAERPL